MSARGRSTSGGSSIELYRVAWLQRAGVIPLYFLLGSWASVGPLCQYLTYPCPLTFFREPGRAAKAIRLWHEMSSPSFETPSLQKGQDIILLSTFFFPISSQVVWNIRKRHSILVSKRSCWLKQKCCSNDRLSHNSVTKKVCAMVQGSWSYRIVPTLAKVFVLFEFLLTHIIVCLVMLYSRAKVSS